MLGYTLYYDMNVYLFQISRWVTVEEVVVQDSPSMLKFLDLAVEMLCPPPWWLHHPCSIHSPTSLYVKLVEDKEQEYILAVGKQLRNNFRASQFFLGGKGDPLSKLDLRWDRLPAEFKPGGLKKKKSIKSVKPYLVKKIKWILKRN